MPMTPLCPSCRQPAETHRFRSHGSETIELDLCFACQGLWFDPQENTRLAQAGVVALFELLHQHRGDARHPIAQRLQCPHCPRALEPGFDVAKGGRYKTFRCPSRHGRFSTFGSLMVEKGFVRHLSVAEIEALAERVGTIQCTSCGGTVDIRNDHACPYCRSALSLLDPQAVDRALNRHASVARAAPATASGSPGPSDVADALVALERARSLERREMERERLTGVGDRFDLLAAGLDLVWTLVRR
ncbi:zf-TFIIB domain-containing protein [Acidovorax sp. GBBC 1281]|uniref:TFIIB-type zinc ribbon-containing protein n=1 Tax=unclassified Acidovorax TaxID=2684926 RepID=UPI00234B9D98|nr:MULTISPECIES: zf-TFIIB domain-containing protein [unclassified Acidovorax]WCM97753.1 zf-TFIIB domain-containing protein [Acidovorax sp. GBBC 1281]